MSGGAEDGMAREYDPAVYRKGLAEIKENMSLDAFVAWGEGMIAAIEVLAKRLEAAERERDEAQREHVFELAWRERLQDSELRENHRAVAAEEERDALRAAIVGPIREHLREAGSIIHSNSDHPERIDFGAALDEINATISACRGALEAGVSHSAEATAEAEPSSGSAQALVGKVKEAVVGLRGDFDHCHRCPLPSESVCFPNCAVEGAALAALSALAVRVEAAEEALRLAEQHAHENGTDQWGYDAAGIHGYEPGEPRGCPLCAALDAARAVLVGGDAADG